MKKMPKLTGEEWVLIVQALGGVLGDAEARLALQKKLRAALIAA